MDPRPQCRLSDQYNRMAHFSVLIVPNLNLPTTMKRLFSFLAIVLVIFISNCSRIPENNDPILGVWARAAIAENDKDQGTRTERQEWIFNDAYLGRYHHYSGDKLEFYTDFGWSVNNGIYTIEYHGTDMPNATVILKRADQPETLALTDGTTFAIRE